MVMTGGVLSCAVVVSTISTNSDLFRLIPSYEQLRDGGGGGSRTRVRNWFQQRAFMLFPVHFVSSPELRTGEDAPATSLIDLARTLQAEGYEPAYCATVGPGP